MLLGESFSEEGFSEDSPSLTSSSNFSIADYAIGSGIAIGGANVNWLLPVMAQTYAVAGSDVTLTLRANKVISAESGSYLVTGTAASTLHKWKVAADSGAYALIGSAATLRRNLPLVAGSGTYAVSGTDAATKLGRKVLVLSGSYAVTGTDASLELGKKVAAGIGTYALTGSDVTLSKVANKTIVADAGAYSLAGTAASTLLKHKVVADPGSYAVTGTAVTLRRNLPLAAGSGSYALTGTAATLRRNLPVVAGSGSYALTGSVVTLQATGAFQVAVEAGAYQITGSDAALIYVPVVVVEQPPTRGELPIDQETGRQRDKARRRREQAVEKDRRDLERMLQGLPPEPERDELEEVFAKAVEVSNTYLMMPDIPIQEIRAIEDIIQQIRVMLEAQATAQAHLQETIALTQVQLRRKSEEDAIIALLLVG